MNYQDKFIRIIVTVTMIVFCSTLLAEVSDENGRRMAWAGDWRTWTVVEIGGEDATLHFNLGDRFRIADVNGMKRFVPRGKALPARLDKEMMRHEFDITDQEFHLPLKTPELREDPTVEQVFCSKIYFRTHKELHYMQIIHNLNDELDIAVEPYESGIEENCGKLSNHGGMAHAND
jgi:hypothetical protein